jgi:hypothetical protein
LRRKRKAGERQCDENWQNYFVFGLDQSIHGSSFLFPRSVESWIAGPEETKNQRGKVLRLIRIRLATLKFERISLARQTQSPQARLADSRAARYALAGSSRVSPSSMSAPFGLLCEVELCRKVPPRARAHTRGAVRDGYGEALNKVLRSLYQIVESFSACR